MNITKPSLSLSLSLSLSNTENHPSLTRCLWKNTIGAIALINDMSLLLLYVLASILQERKVVSHSWLQLMATFELRGPFCNFKTQCVIVKKLNELEKNFYLFSSLGLKFKIRLNLLPTPSN
jgi:hypothetical protein